MSSLAGEKGRSGASEPIDVLRIAAGLGCDGDPIAMTAATQPGIEDVVMGGISPMPQANFHEPFLATANGDDFLEPFHQGARGELGLYILVIEGSIPDQTKLRRFTQASLHRQPTWTRLNGSNTVKANRNVPPSAEHGNVSD